jgi:hypothetical protein
MTPEDLLTIESLLECAEPAWHRDAACREHPRWNWFPEKGIPRQLVAVCERCLVRDECAEAGAGEEFGIWGGLSAPERARRRQAAAQPSHDAEVTLPWL